MVMTASFATTNGMSDREREANRTCFREHREHWWVSTYKGNYSAFNGRHFTPSDYSQVHCDACPRSWRTKAAYVDSLPVRRAAFNTRTGAPL